MSRSKQDSNFKSQPKTLPQSEDNYLALFEE